MDSGFQVLDYGFHSVDSGFQVLHYGLLPCGFRIEVDFSKWIPDSFFSKILDFKR